MIFLRCSSEFAMFCFAVAKMNLGSGMEISTGLYKTDFCKLLRSKTSSVRHDRCFHTFCKRTEFWNRNSFLLPKVARCQLKDIWISLTLSRTYHLLLRADWLVLGVHPCGRDRCEYVSLEATQFFAFVSAGKKQSLFPARFTSVPSRPPKRILFFRTWWWLPTTLLREV